MGNPWTDAMDSDVKRLWADMKSGSQCAQEMARLYPDRPFTRCSILGRINRIGGLDRKNPLMCGRGVHEKRDPFEFGRPKPRLRRSRAKRSVVTGQYVRVPVQPPQLKSINIPFNLLEKGQCKYIAEEVTSFDAIACGAPVWGRESYCAAHCRICYHKPIRNGAHLRTVASAPSGTIASVPPPETGAVVPLS